MKTGIGIAQKLTLIFIAFAGVLVFGVGLFVFSSARDALEAAVESELDAIADEKEAAVRNWLEERLSDIIAISQTAAVREGLADLSGINSGAGQETAHARLVAALASRTGPDQPFASIFIMDPSGGVVIASSDPAEEGGLLDDRPYFNEGKIGPYRQSLYFSTTIQQPAMTVSAPVKSADGDLLGVVAGRLDLSELENIINLLGGNRETLDAYIVTQSNLFATQPRFLEDPAVLQREVRTEAVEACLAGGMGVLRGLNYRGVQAVSAHHWLAEENLCLVVEMEEAEALARIPSLAETIILMVGSALLIAALVAAGLARTISRPILRLQEAALRLEGGDWAHRVPEDSSDELGVLARNFNLMADAFSMKEADLRAQAGELMEANEQLESFSYSVSHDLRAPLRSIDGFAKILFEDYKAKLDEDGQRYIGIVRSAAQQMGKLIDDLLVFSRISREELSARPVEIDKIVVELVEIAQQRQGDRRIDFRIGSLPACYADPDLIRQALENLLANAVKYTRPRQEARIEIAAETIDGETIYSISDNGTGFDMKYVDKLFGVFQRLHRVEEFEGTGVGLAIVRRIIHRHGGRVWAMAEVDRGATFYFSLPDRPPISEGPQREKAVTSLIERARDLV